MTNIKKQQKLTTSYLEILRIAREKLKFDYNSCKQIEEEIIKTKR